MSLTISDVSSDEPVDSLDHPNRFPPTMPFGLWGYVKILSSCLFPPKYEIRTIEDRGALCDSIRDGKLDLFERVPVKEVALVKLARRVGVLASFFFVRLILCPIGVGYHLCHAFKHAVLMIFPIKERGHHLNECMSHVLAAVVDAARCVPGLLAAGMAAHLGFLAKAAAATAVTLAFDLLVSKDLFNLAESVCDGIPREDKYGFYKSFLLRDQFGLVSGKTGGLLNWDPQKDSDVNTFGTTFFGKSYNLKGYFIDLHKKQAEKLLDVIQALQTILPPNNKIPFSYPPKAEKIIAFIKQNPTELSKSEIEEWEQRLLTQEGNMKAIWEIVSQSFTASSKEISTEHFGGVTTIRTTTYNLEEKFPLPESSCQIYYK